MLIDMKIIINFYKINYIKCIYEIKKEDIGKDIQILNNKTWDFPDGAVVKESACQ